MTKAPGMDDPYLVRGLYATAIRQTAADLRREWDRAERACQPTTGLYVCFATIQARLPEYDYETLFNVFVELCRRDGLGR